MAGPFHLQTLGRLNLSGPAGELLPRRRKELAMLVTLADATPRALRREQVQALFWGERDEERARNSFRQALLQLRRALGDAIEGEMEALRLDAGAIVYDARAFSDAVAAKKFTRALQLWAGDFMVACEDVGGEEFRHWLDAERERLRRLLATALEGAVDQAAQSGDDRAMTMLASRWTAEFPHDERARQRLIEALCHSGMLADADAERAAFIRRIRDDLDDEPGAEWLASTERMIDEARQSASSATQPFVRHAAAEATTAPMADSGLMPRPAGRYIVAAIGVAVLLVATTILGRRTRGGADNAPVLAVGTITGDMSPDSTRGFATMLAINLARIRGLDVVSERRISELATRDDRRSLDSIARVAGATQLVEGIVTRRPDGSLRADMRRTDLSSGRTRGGYVLEGPDFLQLADLITESVARDLGLEAPAVRREATTSSLIAYRLYEQGLRAHHDREARSAERFFTAALAEDSTFAMAALYKSFNSRDSGYHYLTRAHRIAPHLNDRERLFITAMWRRGTADPHVLELADTILMRYPSEPDAHLIAGEELARRGQHAAALAHFRRVVEMDSALAGSRKRCRACDAAFGVIEAYRGLDSIPAAERFARLWLTWEPTSVQAWETHSRLMGDTRRYAEAHAAIDSLVKYSNDAGKQSLHTIWWFRENNFAAIDRVSEEMQRSTNPDVRMNGLWTRAISSRTQGRMDEALAAAQEYRRYSVQLNRGVNPNYGAALAEGVTRFDAGQYRRSAALFDSMARRYTPPAPTQAGAHRAFHWTHMATALAAARDTAPLAWIEDSVRVNGAVALARHGRLYHYVRGLRLQARGRPLEAAESFRNAIDPEVVYVRIYLELGRSLIAAGRPGEAIAPLESALRGPTSAAGLYATRSELQELLGLAYERNRQPDSAIAQYRFAIQAWSSGDREFAARRAQLQSRVAALTLSPADTAVRGRLRRP